VTHAPSESSHRTRSFAAMTAGLSGSSPSSRRAWRSSSSTLRLMCRHLVRFRAGSILGAGAPTCAAVRRIAAINPTSEAMVSRSRTTPSVTDWPLWRKSSLGRHALWPGSRFASKKRNHERNQEERGEDQKCDPDDELREQVVVTDFYVVAIRPKCASHPVCRRSRCTDRRYARACVVRFGYAVFGEAGPNVAVIRAVNR
jgi:hypothetical protein